MPAGDEAMTSALESDGAPCRVNDNPVDDGTPDDPPAEQRPSAREWRIIHLVAFVGMAIYLVAAIFAISMFRLLVPHEQMLAWAIPSGLFLIVWFSLQIVVMRRRPDEAETRRVWQPVARMIMWGIVVVTTSSIWLFMPYADDQQRLVMVIFYLIHVPSQIMSTSDDVNVDRLGTVAILGSISAVLLIYGGPYASIVAAFTLIFAVSMLMLAALMRRSVREVVRAREQSDAVAQALRRALRDIAAERDIKTRFIASASHDLSQPLQAARMFFDQAMRSDIGPKRDKAVHGVHWAFDTTEQLLGQMMAHLQLESGVVEPKGDAFVIGPLIAEIADMNEPAAVLAKVSIHAMPCGLVVRADPALVRRALGNLIGNAIRHAKAKRILIGARKRGGAVRLWVIDDGTGIPAVDVPRLFEDYVQGSDHGPDIRGGFGLGLATTRRLARLMGGDAGLEPNWVSGAAFWLELPSGKMIANPTGLLLHEIVPDLR